VVVLRNGDHLTGEIKSMSRGKLDLSTDDAGRVSIEWVKVARVSSTYFYEAELASGRKYFGLLHPPPDGEAGVVVIDADALAIPEVVALTPLDAVFWSRLKAYLDVGFTLAKSNRATTDSRPPDPAAAKTDYVATFTVGWSYRR
jgi:hypothetical protein